MSSVSGHTMVEGIGDELVYAVGTFCAIVIPLIIFAYKRPTVVYHIHPDYQQNIRDIREQLNQQQQQQGVNGRADENVNQNQQTPIRLNNGELECPICLAEARFAAQTNCGHVFCGECIVHYWQHGTWLGAIKCPICRQIVTILLINFTREEHNNSSEEKRNIVDNIYQYNRRFSGQPRPWMDYIRDLPTLLRHAIRETFTVGGLVWMFRLRVVVCLFAAVLYFISPLDIIPEAVFGLLGFLDDFFILLLLAIYISLVYRQLVQNRATDGQTVGNAQ